MFHKFRDSKFDFHSYFGKLFSKIRLRSSKTAYDFCYQQDSEKFIKASENITNLVEEKYRYSFGSVQWL